MASTQPSDLPASERYELQNCRKLLKDEQQEYFDLIIKLRGEAAVYATLGHLKGQLKYVDSL